MSRMTTDLEALAAEVIAENEAQGITLEDIAAQVVAENSTPDDMKMLSAGLDTGSAIGGAILGRNTQPVQGPPVALAGGQYRPEIAPVVPQGMAYGGYLPGQVAPRDAYAAAQPPTVSLMPGGDGQIANIVRGLDRGVNVAGTQIGGAMAAAGNFLPGSVGRQLVTRGEDYAAQQAMMRDQTAPTTTFAGGVAEAVPGLVGAIGAGVLTGGVAPALGLGAGLAGTAVGAGVAGAQSGGGQYVDAMERLQNRGIVGDTSRDKAAASAAGTGAVSAVTSVIPMGRYLSRFIPATVASGVMGRIATTRAGRIVMDAAAEGSQEAVEEIGSMIAQDLAENDPNAYNEFAPRLAQAFGAGAVLGGVVGGAMDVATGGGPEARARQAAAMRERSVPQPPAPTGDTTQTAPQDSGVSSPSPVSPPPATPNVASATPDVAAPDAPTITPEAQARIDALYDQIINRPDMPDAERVAMETEMARLAGDTEYAASEAETAPTVQVGDPAADQSGRVAGAADNAGTIRPVGEAVANVVAPNGVEAGTLAGDVVGGTDQVPGSRMAEANLTRKEVPNGEERQGRQEVLNPAARSSDTRPLAIADMNEAQLRARAAELGLNAKGAIGAVRRRLQNAERSGATQARPATPTEQPTPPSVQAVASGDLSPLQSAGRPTPDVAAATASPSQAQSSVAGRASVVEGSSQNPTPTGSQYAISSPKGYHLTARNKSVISQMLAQGAKSAKSGNTRYDIEGDGPNYTVRITTREANDRGQVQNRERTTPFVATRRQAAATSSAPDAASVVSPVLPTPAQAPSPAPAQPPASSQRPPTRGGSPTAQAETAAAGRALDEQSSAVDADLADFSRQLGAPVTRAQATTPLQRKTVERMGKLGRNVVFVTDGSGKFNGIASNRDTRTVYIRADADQKTTVKVLAHELLHSLVREDAAFAGRIAEIAGDARVAEKTAKYRRRFADSFGEDSPEVRRFDRDENMRREEGLAQFLEDAAEGDPDAARLLYENPTLMDQLRRAFDRLLDRIGIKRGTVDRRALRQLLDSIERNSERVAERSVSWASNPVRTRAEVSRRARSTGEMQGRAGGRDALDVRAGAFEQAGLADAVTQGWQTETMFAFKGPFPGEVRSFLQGQDRRVRALFSQNNPNGTGADALSALGTDAYFRIALEEAGVSDANEQIDALRRDPDPENQYAAAVAITAREYELTPVTKRRRNKETGKVENVRGDAQLLPPKIPIAAARLQPGDIFFVNDRPVRVLQDEEERRVLVGGPFKGIYVDGLGTIPIDKKSWHREGTAANVRAVNAMGPDAVDMPTDRGAWGEETSITSSAADVPFSPRSMFDRTDDAKGTGNDQPTLFGIPANARATEPPKLTLAERRELYPGIKPNETIAQYERRMGTADTPMMFAPRAVAPESFDPDNIPKGVARVMYQKLKAQGYDIRSVDDMLDLGRKRIGAGGKVNADWIAAYDAARGSQAKAAATRDASANERDRWKNVNWARIRELGYTTNPREAGYITPDGKLVDLSGKREGGTPGERGLDHREAGGTVGMQELMASGYVRWMPESNGIDLAVMPSDAQLRVLETLIRRANGEVLVDLDDGLGEMRDGWYMQPRRTWQAEYPEGTKAAKVIGDIRRFYAGEDLPQTDVRFSPRSLPPTIDVDGQQRPTTNSDGKPIAQDEASVRNFWRWFGASRVVDEQGRPKVVYHGTKGNFSTFDISRSGASGAAYRTPLLFASDDPQVASGYAIESFPPEVGSAKLKWEASFDRLQELVSSLIDKVGYGDATRTIERSAKYASPQRALAPLSDLLDERRITRDEYDTLVSAFEQEEANRNSWDDLTRSLATSAGANVMPMYARVLNPRVSAGGGMNWQSVMPENVARMTDRQDGVIVESVQDNAVDDGRISTVVAVRDASQFKSATGNLGTFDPANPDIRFAPRGMSRIEQRNQERADRVIARLEKKVDATAAKGEERAGEVAARMAKRLDTEREKAESAKAAARATISVLQTQLRAAMTREKGLSKVVGILETMRARQETRADEATAENQARAEAMKQMRATQREVEQVKDAVVRIVRDALPVAMHGKFIADIQKVRSKQELPGIVAKVNKAALQAQAKELEARLSKTVGANAMNLGKQGREIARTLGNVGGSLDVAVVDNKQLDKLVMGKPLQKLTSEERESAKMLIRNVVLAAREYDKAAGESNIVAMQTALANAEMAVASLGTMIAERRAADALFAKNQRKSLSDSIGRVKQVMGRLAQRAQMNRLGQMIGGGKTAVAVDMADAWNLARMIDGGKDGPFRRLLMEPLADGMRRFNRAVDEMYTKADAHARNSGFEDWDDAMRRLGGSYGESSTITYKLDTAIGGRTELQAWQALKLYAMDQETLAHTLNGRQWHWDQNGDGFDIDWQQYNALLRAIPDEHKALVDALKRDRDDIFQAFADMVKLLTGIEPPKVTGYDIHRVLPKWLAENIKVDEAVLAGANGHVIQTLENVGMGKARTSTKAPLLVTNFMDDWRYTIDQQSRVTHLAMPVRNAKRIMKDASLQADIVKRVHANAITRFLGDPEKRTPGIIDDVAGTNQQAPRGTVDRVVIGGTRNAAKGFTALSERSMLNNLGGLATLWANMPMRAWADGMAGLRNTTLDEVMENVDFVRSEYGRSAYLMKSVATLEAQANGSRRPGALAQMKRSGQTIGVASKEFAKSLRNIKNPDLMFDTMGRTGKEILGGVGSFTDGIPLLHYFASRPAVVAYAGWKAEAKRLGKDDAWVAERVEETLGGTQGIANPLRMTGYQSRARGTWRQGIFTFINDSVRMHNMLVEAALEGDKKKFAKASAAIAFNLAWVPTVTATTSRPGQALIAAMLLGMFSDEEKLDPEEIRKLWEDMVRTWRQTFFRDVGGVIAPGLGDRAAELMLSPFINEPLGTPFSSLATGMMQGGKQILSGISELIEGDDLAGKTAREKLADGGKRLLFDATTAGTGSGVPTLYRRLDSWWRAFADEE